MYCSSCRTRQINTNLLLQSLRCTNMLRLQQKSRKVQYIYIEGDAKFAGWGSHLIKHQKGIKISPDHVQRVRISVCV